MLPRALGVCHPLALAARQPMQLAQATRMPLHLEPTMHKPQLSPGQVSKACHHINYECLSLLSQLLVLA